MSPRIVIVGGGSYHWAPRLLCDFANTPSLAGARCRVARSRRRATEAHGGARPRDREAAGDRPHDQRRARPQAGARGRRLRHHVLLGRRLRQHAARHRDPAPLRHPPADRRQRRVREGSCARCAACPVLLDIARDVEAVAPDAWFVNVTNPLTALCRSVTARDGGEDRRAVQRVGRRDVQPEPRPRLRHGRSRSRCSRA